MKWILNLTYACLLMVLSPVIIWRFVRHGRYRKGLPEKLFGRLPRLDSTEQTIWFHAVSVGEVLQLRTLVDDFQKSAPNSLKILISTSTDSGYELASERFPDCEVTWFPLDFSWAVSNALHRVNPALVILVELELWPNFLGECKRRNIKTALVNARMSDRSFQGYSRIQSLTAPLFSAFAVAAAQNKEYADRLRLLGASLEATSVTGSIKFDGVCCDRNNTGTQQLKQLFQFQSSDRVFIAGSTQAPEELLALQAYHDARLQFPELRLVLVPRHRERFDEVAALVGSSRFPCVRRSSLHDGDRVPQNAVIILDTIGELSHCWGMADVAFVGGSFGPREGQNMLEPAAFGAAVMFGPRTRNFRQIVAHLLAAEAAIELPDEDSMLPELMRTLDSNKLRVDMGQRAQQIVLTQQGAIARTTRLLLAVLNVHSRPDSASLDSKAA